MNFIAERLTAVREFWSKHDKVEWYSLLRIQEALGLIIGPDSGYPD
jgi:hypothetical protein